jgi:predicted amino acid dehydrogenase
MDDAHPVNVRPERYDDFGTPLFEGDSAEIPGYRCQRLDRYFGASLATAPACLAETYLVAKEGMRETSVGRPSVDRSTGSSEPPSGTALGARR